MGRAESHVAEELAHVGVVPLNGKGFVRVVDGCWETVSGDICDTWLGEGTTETGGRRVQW